jgi:hypothetical protein
VIAFLVAAVGDVTFAQDSKPNTLTPKEIAEGWLLLFDGETTFGWKRHVNLRIDAGQLVIGGDAEALVTTTAKFGDGVFSFEHRHLSKRNESELAFRRGSRLLLSDSSWTKEAVDTRKDKLSHLRSTIGFDVPAGTTLAMRNIKFRPDASQSLFNGKDLAGWKVFPGKKSEFAVIDGAINIKDGPGDLQTEKQFGDFLLQFECKSHGKHLNSGVFFRCRPNEYQNGYEAQVRNQFTETPTQKYLLEEYDPETHKLLGKKEAMFTAVDFGTGAIYRRQPARKEMSKDGEWFTMTVAAHGNHIATWVNGVQVTDWFDHRPKSDNARTGCRLEAGHISLQGHDPTTDLSFRNFRIQEYPAK